MAGLVAGDVIIRLEGERVIGGEDLIGAVSQHKVGDKIKIEYRRGRDYPEVTVVLTPIVAPAGESPKSPAKERNDRKRRKAKTA